MEQQTSNLIPTDQIIGLLLAQYPQRQDIIRAMRLCNTGRWESPAYVYFVDARDADMPDSPWQFSENIVLESDEYGEIVLDVLKDGRIGGIEFVNRIQD